MRRMKDEDFISDAVRELEEEFGYTTSVIDKHAFDISINPASVVGGIAGSLIGGAISRKKQLQKAIESNKPPQSSLSLGKNYYDEVKNIADNLQVLFTPLSVIYIVKINNRQITLDTIDTEEMDDEMYDAWRRRDTIYFKNLLLNKMYSELQLVEQMFAKRMLEKKMQIQKALKKEASTVSADDINFEDMVEGVCQLKELAEKKADSKIIEMIVNSFDSDTDYAMPWTLERPISKYASVLSDTLRFFGLDTKAKDIRAMQKKYMNPRYLAKNLQVSFLPDRILFIVDNLVITQLPVMKLNSQGMDQFQKQNKRYFKQMFLNEINKNSNHVKARIQQQEKMQRKINKQASEKPKIADIFLNPDIHPVIYLLELNKKYGNEWVDFDPEVLIKAIEEDYNLKEPINSIALNKILTIQTLNKSPLPFENAFIFEKCVRALNGKQIDFDIWEPDLSVGELMFGLQVMDALSPSDDIFDNFSENVMDYLVTILVNRECRSVDLKSSVIDSPLEKEFFKILNSDLTKAWNTKVVSDANDDEDVDLALKDNELIVNLSRTIIRTVRKQKNVNPEAISALVDKIAKTYNISDRIVNVIKQDVRHNIAVDIMLNAMDALLDKQRKMYNL